MQVRSYKEKEQHQYADGVDIRWFILAWRPQHATPYREDSDSGEKKKYRHHEIDCRIYAFKCGIGKPEIVA